jgi:hypothetical protein
VRVYDFQNVKIELIKNIKDNMRIIKIIIYSWLVWLLFLILVWKYIHSKTLWFDKTDCMVNYIQNHYPIWSTYMIFWKYPHIDKRWIWNENMIETKEINGCFINDKAISFIYNTPYCYWTLLFEKWLNIE